MGFKLIEWSVIIIIFPFLKSIVVILSNGIVIPSIEMYFFDISTFLLWSRINMIDKYKMKVRRSESGNCPSLFIKRNNKKATPISSMTLHHLKSSLSIVTESDDDSDFPFFKK